MNENVNKLNDVLTFWFEELSEKDWWMKSDELDEKIRTRFGELHQLAKKGKLEAFSNSETVYLPTVHA